MSESKTPWTPGPWAWFGNARHEEVYLATTHSGRRYVMGFRRWGMRGAQPMFQPGEHGLVAAKEMFTFEVGDRSIRGVEAAKADDSVYRLDINGIDSADARLIAAAPEMASIIQRFIALPSGAWYPERHAAEEAELMQDARALLAKIGGQS